MTAIPHVHGAPILKVSSGEPQRSLSLVPDNATSGDSRSPHCSKGTTLMDMSSTMTHYMELLASNQPWNLLIFMAIPVIFAEFIAVTELSILFQRNLGGTIKRLNSYAGLFVGFYFVGVFVYLLFNAVIPITAAGAWRGPADVIAVGFYLLGVVPLLGMALLELKVVGRSADAQARLKLHAVFVGLFLVVAHIAMIFGMLNPSVL